VPFTEVVFLGSFPEKIELHLQAKGASTEAGPPPDRVLWRAPHAGHYRRVVCFVVPTDEQTSGFQGPGVAACA